MNIKKIALASFGVNLLLAAMLLWLRREPTVPEIVVIETNAPVKVVETKVPAPVKVVEPFDWKKVESEDYRQYIANLRAIGCPEQTVRDIIIADVNALFEARRRPFIEPEEEFQFWKPGPSPLFSSPPAERIRERFEQLRLLSAEKKAVLRELLGVEVPERAEAVFAPLSPREQLLTFLPEEKRMRVEEIERRYSSMLMARSPGASGGEQLTDYKKWQADKRAELVSVLTPQEFENYELRFSPSAVTLRSRLGNLNPTEQEFREMVRVRKKYDDEFGDFVTSNSNDPGVRSRREEAERRMNEEMSRLLGSKRYEEHLKENDPVYQGASVAAAQSGLPASAASAVVEMKRIAEAETIRIRADASLGPAERQNQLNEVRLAVEEAAAKLLGANGYDAYQKQFGSAWMRGLNQPDATAPVQRAP